MTHHAEIVPEKTIQLGEFEIQIHGKKVEITKGDKRYDILTAYPDHPYCEKAEGHFKTTLAKVHGNYEHNATSRLHRNQTITIYLRNRETFLVEQTTFTGDIIEKSLNVRSGMVMEPKELQGIICCPPKTPQGNWIAVRPYDPSYLNPIGSSKPSGEKPPATIPSHVIHLPNIRPEKNHAARLHPNEIRNIDFSALPPNIILAEKELREYFTHSSYAIFTETEPYTTKKVTTGEDNKDDDYYIVCKSPFAWRKLDEPLLDFARSTRDDSGKGYFEVIRGKLIQDEKGLVFKPEKTPSKPDLLDQCVIYKLRNNPKAAKAKIRKKVIGTLSQH